MSALYIMQIDNVIVETNALEMPIVDGSAQLFLQKLQEVGTTKLEAPRKYIKVLKKVEIYGTIIKISAEKQGG